MESVWTIYFYAAIALLAISFVAMINQVWLLSVKTDPFEVGAPIVAVVLFVGLFFFTQAAERKAFIEQERASRMEIETVKKLFSPDEQGECRHVSRLDGKPVAIYLSNEQTPPVLCGLSHDELAGQRMVPVIKNRDEYQILVGDWPLSYILSSTSKSTPDNGILSNPQ